MTQQTSAGLRFRQALEVEKPLQIIGTVNAYAAMMAKQVGYKAIYVSGAGVANYSYGLPDLGMTSLDNVLEDVRRITERVDTPLLVDIDTGWGGAFNIARTIKQMISAGAAAVHIEDQVAQKRCGHRPNKEIVSQQEMVDRIKAAVDAKTDSNFVVMARTDALQKEGLQAVIDRACACVEAGADAIFAEAMTDITMYKTVCDAVGVPVLANITEFGDTPYYTTEELGEQGISMVLYPLSATRAMQKAALEVFRSIRENGTQTSCSRRRNNKMAEGKVLTGAGLRGQVAGKTALSTVGKSGAGLTYRGYDVQDLAENCQFEEVAYLIFFGELPTAEQLAAYKAKLKSLRQLPQALKEVLERIPADSHPMDVMRTGVSMLGNLETEKSFEQQQDVADRILATLPAIICYWYRFSHDGVRIEENTDDDSIGAQFLHLLRGEKPNELHEQVMNVSLILYAEHEFNASTFTARVCASTLSDMHSCITGAIGSLRGPLHGGANEAAMEMIENWTSPEEAEREMLGKLERKEKIMGFGHAIYKDNDPRNGIIKIWSERLAKDVGDTVLYPVSVRCEEVMWREKKLFCNADFFHASAYHFMDIATKLFTPIFVMSRVTGWAAHVMEQRADNRIIRPSADYTGPELRKVVPIAERSAA
ncbi:hypothetical protein FQR65_LT17499 [Abscondita terminalis]|nr:hypothetical protein FQR65_LT17499 [Abscondita terminalis]